MEVRMKMLNGVEIYEELEEIADPKHSCLVVWDVQNGLVDRIYNKDEFLGNTARLLAGLRGKMPVFYTLITPPPRQFTSGWGYFTMMRRYGIKDPAKLPAFMAPGTPEREVPETVRPAGGDVVLEKPAASIFIGTNFENLLRARGIKTVIFTGIATEIGVESSARDASNRGFYPVVVSDCVSSMDKAAHERSLENMKRLAVVESSSAVLGAVNG
jgi:nicotinamidase-related amidase